MKILISIVLVAFVAAEQKREADPPHGSSVGPRFGVSAVATNLFGHLPVARSHLNHHRLVDVGPRIHSPAFLTARRTPLLIGSSYGPTETVAYQPSESVVTQAEPVVQQPVYEYGTSLEIPGYVRSFRYQSGVGHSHSEHH